MERNCERHPFEVAENECQLCAGAFCADCLLYAFGPDNPPFCKACAITAGGVRSTARNPRRTTKPARGGKRRRRSGGLFARLRGSGSDEESEVPLTEEERLELEAQEARALLDAQRLPGEPHEEPEPEPTPNIAPPGDRDEERELAHRAVPDVVAGGLDLRDDDGVDVPPKAPPFPPENDEVPEWARPEAAAAPAPEAEHPAPVIDDHPTPAEPAPEAERPPTVVDPAPAVAEAPDPGSVRIEPEPAAPDAPPADPPEPAVAAPVGSVQPSAPTPPVPNPDTRTADGVPLFASPSSEPAAPEAPAKEPAPSGTTLADAPPEHLPSETSELLKRIADLRGR